MVDGEGHLAKLQTSRAVAFGRWLGPVVIALFLPLVMQTAITPVVSAPPVGTSNTAETPTVTPVHLPLVFNRTMAGLLPASQWVTYDATIGADAEGNDTLIILAQSDDFAVALSYSYQSATGGGGSGAGGCGDCLTSGSPVVEAEVRQVHPGDRIGITVSHWGGGPLGSASRYNLTVYRGHATPITEGRTYPGTLDSSHPYQYYTFSASLGDTLTATLTSRDTPPVQLSLIDRGSSGAVSSSAMPKPQVVDYYVGADGQLGLLLLPMSGHAIRHYSLTYQRKPVPSLENAPQTLRLAYHNYYPLDPYPMIMAPSAGALFHAAAGEQVELTANLLSSSPAPVDLVIIAADYDLSSEPLYTFKLADSLAELITLPADGSYVVQASLHPFSQDTVVSVQVGLTHHRP